MAGIDKRLLEPEARSMQPNKEVEEWARHGCKNREEWHCFLKRCAEYDLVPPERHGCYI